MASSYVEYNNRGFWVKDGLLRIVDSYLYLCIKNQPYEEDWILEMAEYIRLNSVGYFNGFMNYDFDKYLIDQGRINTVVSIIQKTIDFLSSKPQHLNLSEDLEAVLDDELKDLYAGLPGNRNKIIETLYRLIGLIRNEDHPPLPRADNKQLVRVCRSFPPPIPQV